MPSVLFVCTANRFRSPLALAFFQDKLQEAESTAAWKIDSAGTWAASGLPVLSDVLLIARKYGLDLSRHRSKLVTGSLLTAHDLILVMEAGHKESLEAEFISASGRIYLLSQAAEGRVYDIPDMDGSLESMMEISGNLHQLIQTGYQNILNLAIRSQGRS